MTQQRDETRDRFLAAIADRLEPDTIEEAHVFSPIKQGGVESGVAVLAVDHRPLTGDETAAGNRGRLTVYMAKYRLTLKGPDRGRWEFSLQAEADAPLLTVDKVVRGVRQRSGDVEEPVRLSGGEFRALLPLTS